jgi:hypothetical protein
LVKEKAINSNEIPSSVEKQKSIGKMSGQDHFYITNLSEFDDQEDIDLSYQASTSKVDDRSRQTLISKASLSNQYQKKPIAAASDNNRLDYNGNQRKNAKQRIGKEKQDLERYRRSETPIAIDSISRSSSSDSFYSDPSFQRKPAKYLYATDMPKNLRESLRVSINSLYFIYYNIFANRFNKHN